MLLTYLHGSRHGTDTYVLGLPTTFPWLSSSSNQTIMVMLFTNHSPAWCLEYDSLFRQAAARDPTLRWDTIKEDIYVWAITHHHNTSTFQFQSNTSTFRDRLPISARLGPPAAESGKATPPHTTLHCRRQRNLQAVQCGMLHKGGGMHLHTRLLAPRLPG